MNETIALTLGHCVPDEQLQGLQRWWKFSDLGVSLPDRDVKKESKQFVDDIKYLELNSTIKSPRRSSIDHTCTEWPRVETLH